MIHRTGCSPGCSDKGTSEMALLSRLPFFARFGALGPITYGTRQVSDGRKAQEARTRGGELSAALSPLVGG